MELINLGALITAVLFRGRLKQILMKLPFFFCNICYLVEKKYSMNLPPLAKMSLGQRAFTEVVFVMLCPAHIPSVNCVPSSLRFNKQNPLL